MLRGYASGRLICVFGCGGDRDTGKRALMGQTAAAVADLLPAAAAEPPESTPSDGNGDPSGDASTDSGAS